ncbi:helix-turn-helix domain-containing protein (plasmid) [Streptomyces sp. BI20]|uniref:helix-turn-helix domain-containing protein n=1 Tax=Streptomyces sp. BI20 TaxID=3403460 RepID=UPI003C7868DE
MRLKAEARAKLAALLRTEYDAGASVRDLVAKHGRSYGNTLTLLHEAGTVLRGRGGGRPRRTPAA